MAHRHTKSGTRLNQLSTHHTYPFNENPHLRDTDPLKVWGALGQLVSSMNHKQKSAQGFWKSFGFHDIGIIPSFYFSLNIFSYLKVQMGGLVGIKRKKKLEQNSNKTQTLCDPMDCSPPGSSVYGISQARILKWVAISYSRGSSRPRV